MEISIENKIIVHVEDGYFKQFIVRDDPDAPEIAGRIIVREKNYIGDSWKNVASFTFNKKEIPKMIEALSKYGVS